MQPAEPPPTGLNRPLAETDWGGFADAYGRATLEWLRQLGLESAEAGALTRELFAVIALEFLGTAREPTVRFRSWLQHAGHTAWCRVMEESVAGSGEIPASPARTLLLSVDSHDTFLKAMDAECTHQRRRDVLARAQKKANAADWEAYYLTVLESRPVDEAAGDLQSSALAVRGAVYRVNRILQDELRRLELRC